MSDSFQCHSKAFNVTMTKNCNYETENINCSTKIKANKCSLTTFYPRTKTRQRWDDMDTIRDQQ